MKIRTKRKGIRIRFAHNPDGSIGLDGAPRDVRKAERWLAEAEPYHEAAHAVLSLVLGVDVDYVTVVEGEAATASGHSTMTGATCRAVSSDPHVNAVIAIAGVLWDEGMNRIPLELAKSQAPTDGTAFVHFAPTQPDRIRAIERASELLDEHQTKVWAVGRALAEKKRLTGAEVRAIMESAS